MQLIIFTTCVERGEDRMNTRVSEKFEKKDITGKWLNYFLNFSILIFMHYIFLGETNCMKK